MFQLECRHVHRTAQAIDLARRLRNEVAIAAAIKIANHFGKASMAQKLEDMLQQRVEEKEQEDAEEDNINDENYDYQSENVQNDYRHNNHTSNKATTGNGVRYHTKNFDDDMLLPP